uniref:Kringle domain-containing protein n=1 Tax=Macrostomum lignano TaxID=282301 RepID=A0A1I8FUB7_9PLAT
ATRAPSSSLRCTGRSSSHGLLLCPTGDQDEAAGQRRFRCHAERTGANCGEPCDIDGWTDEQLNSFVLAPAAAVGPGTRRLLCPREPDDRASFFSSLRFAPAPAGPPWRRRRPGRPCAPRPLLRRLAMESPNCRPVADAVCGAAFPDRSFALCVGANLPFESAV